MSGLDAVILNKVTQLANSGGGISPTASKASAKPITLPKKVGQSIKKGEYVSVDTLTGEVIPNNGGCNTYFSTRYAQVSPADRPQSISNILKVSEGRYIVADQHVSADNKCRFYLIDGLGNRLSEIGAEWYGIVGNLIQFYRYDADHVMILQSNRAQNDVPVTAYNTTIRVYKISTNTWSSSALVTFASYGMASFFQHLGKQYILKSFSGTGTIVEITSVSTTGVTLVNRADSAANAIYLATSRVYATAHVVVAYNKYNTDNTGGSCIMPDGKMLIAGRSASSPREVMIYNIANSSTSVYTVPAHPSNTHANIISIFRVSDSLVLVGYVSTSVSCRYCLYEYSLGVLTPVDGTNSFVTASDSLTSWICNITFLRVSDSKFLIGSAGNAANYCNLYEVTVNPVSKSITKVVNNVSPAGYFGTVLNVDVANNELITGYNANFSTIVVANSISITPDGLIIHPKIRVGKSTKDCGELDTECEVSLIAAHYDYSGIAGEFSDYIHGKIYSVTDSIAIPAYTPSCLESLSLSSVQVATPSKVSSSYARLGNAPGGSTYFDVPYGLSPTSPDHSVTAIFGDVGSTVYGYKLLSTAGDLIDLRLDNSWSIASQTGINLSAGVGLVSPIGGQGVAKLALLGFGSSDFSSFTIDHK